MGRGIDMLELRLLGRIGPDELGPDGLITRRIVALALLDGTEDMIECRAHGTI